MRQYYDDNNVENVDKDDDDDDDDDDNVGEEIQCGNTSHAQRSVTAGHNQAPSTTWTMLMILTTKYNPDYMVMMLVIQFGSEAMQFC